MNSLVARAPWLERFWRAAQRWAIAWWRIMELGAVVLVLLASPSSWGRQARGRMARQIVRDTLPILLGFTVLAALISLVLTRIVVVTAFSYGLSRYALEMVVRVLVLELIPLTAALFVAMRTTIPSGAQVAQLRRLRRMPATPFVRTEVLPRAVAGVYASVTLAALSCVVGLVMAYIGVYGANLAGFAGYTRMFGQVFTPQITLVFFLKTLFFSLAVALIPLAGGLHAHERRSAAPPAAGGGSLARMFAVLLLIETISLMGNYY
ncbi:MlaE family ABC transporter permease [Comamonas flocculans]|uniref:ABC transporter permease n=1 Tax=Comamonas flocculans TaxID=2597701 RepID=A0A5B8RT58_9BURK|nr:ABC transporter permease [Comamonas flocculans]QEA11914.1 ABC transporter permease [Comamonas flocculans]